MTAYPKVIFPSGFDERAVFEMEMKGWISVVVEITNGTQYPVFFSDPIRLQQDLADAAEQGTPWFAEPGLVVVPSLTIEVIERTVNDLCKQGFFDSLRSLNEEQY